MTSAELSRKITTMLAEDLGQPFEDVLTKVLRHVRQGHIVMTSCAEDGTVHGVLFAMLWQGVMADEPCLYVDYLHVSQKMRNQGIGMELLQRVCSDARAAGINRVALYEASPDLAPFYAKAGFTRTLVGVHDRLIVSRLGVLGVS